MWDRFNEQIEIKNRDNVTHEQKHFLIMYYMLTERINLEYKIYSTKTLMLVLRKYYILLI